MTAELKFPTRENIGEFTKIVDLNLDEEAYWEDMKKRRDVQFDKADQQGKINFYLQELKATDGRFGERVAVARRLKYAIGHAHEYLGTFSLEGHEPLERAKMFEKAVLWYQAADETAGFFSDYVLRQVESCWGVARFRREGGIEDDRTEAFAKRGNDLVKAFVSALGGVSLTIIDGPVPEYLKRLANIETDSVVEAYWISSQEKGDRR